LENIKTSQWYKRNVATILVLAALLLSFGSSCLAADYVALKIYPEHAGVFIADGEQQYVAFGVKSDGSRVNITSQVAWGSSDASTVTIDENGLATVVGAVTSGQVEITCSYPKRGNSLASVNRLLLGPMSPPVAQYTVGVTASGLAVANSVILQNNADDDLIVDANNSFTFATSLVDGAGYDVTVLNDPTVPNQTCVVTGGSATDNTGTISGANVDLTVTCTTVPYTVGGNVSGLVPAGDSVFLLINGLEEIEVTIDGPFTFPTSLDDGTIYTVTISEDPVDADCVFTGGTETGTILGANVDDVTVVCTAI
jgi:hypothetical protein